MHSIYEFHFGVNKNIVDFYDSLEQITQQKNLQKLYTLQTDNKCLCCEDKFAG